MQVQEVRRAIVCLQHCKVLRAKMRVPPLAWQDRKEKAEICVVGVQQIQLAEIHRIVAGHGSEVRVELVVSLNKEIAVCVGEDARELADELVSFALGGRIYNNGQ